MARKVVKIKDSETYFDNRFKCENLVWKKEDTHTSIAWCKIVDKSCKFHICPKVNNNK